MGKARENANFSLVFVIQGFICKAHSLWRSSCHKWELQYETKQKCQAWGTPSILTQTYALAQIKY